MQLEIVLAVAAIAMAFLTSTWVNAVSRLSKGRAAALEGIQPKRGKRLVKIAEDPSPFISSVLLVMLVARVTATVLVTGLVMRTSTRLPELLAIVLMSFVLFELAEVAPRTWVLERLERVLLMSARPVYWIGTILRPISGLLVRVSRIFMLILPGRGLPKGPLTSEEEIKSLLDVAESEEVIESEERSLIDSIFEFTDTVVREVMTPRPDMVCVEASSSLDEVLAVTLKSGFSRVPVIDASIDQIKGIAYQKDVIKRLHNGKTAKAKTAADAAREAKFIPESKKVAELLREMQRDHIHMVIVVDEYGGTAGLATLEDLLEEIVGEIEDEYDREEPNVERIDDTTLRVSPRLDIEELNELLGVDLPHSEWDSVGGLVGGLLGKVPSEGDVIEHQELEFLVEKMKGRRISKLIVRGVVPEQAKSVG